MLVLARRDDPALGAGDRLLGRMLPPDEPEAPLAARVIRRIGMGPKPGDRHLPRGRGAAAGSPRSTSAPTATGRWRPATAPGPARASWSRPSSSGRPRAYGLPRARVVARLGDPSAPKAVSLIAIHEHGIPDAFPEEALAEAEAARPVGARQARGPARAAVRDHRPLGRPRPRRRGLRPCRRRPGEPRRPRRLGGDRRRRPLRAAGLGARPRGAAARQLDLLPRPGGADAARPAVGRPLLADRRRRPAVHRGAAGARRRRPQARATASPAG